MNKYFSEKEMSVEIRYTLQKEINGMAFFKEYRRKDCFIDE